ncbi:DUF3800 domain-containing protein [Streptomyces sp. M2CJ-2]|uniref:DUF3800 domain-containing protein n=1 Tax=Streptomyces sp. M2CJ-2 TaxID=2803948 RepID=UPI0019289477|nr:DUF3800 domain-containing protein [Streptomyces sp. M2CJ-2]MBL3668436.1 DUF3800 domain-containing protein [Streptomyces sp. M2CJ-2]
MYFAFMDDSSRKRKDVPRDGLGALHAYGAVVFPQEALQPYREQLAQLRQELGVPAGTEFKWSPDGGPLHKKWDELHTARVRMLEAAAELGVRACVVICAPELMPEWYSESKLKSEMLEYLYERVTYTLGEEKGIVIADQPGGGRKDETRWLADALALDTDGTQYVKPANKQILLPIITTRSDHVDHLQLADLVASATTALIAGAPAADRYKDLIYKLLAKNSRDYAGGTGLKFIPSTHYNWRALMNLAYWVFGEDAYVLPDTASSMGTALPHGGWIFASNNGLGDPDAAATQP